MNAVHAKSLDLNLLPVLVTVADTGSVTEAARRLYLTQSAISAALGRLKSALGEALVVRHGRGVVLTDRGARLVAEARPLLDALVQTALQPTRFDARTSDRTIRIGLSDVAEEWLLPRVLHVLETEAPRMRVVSSAVQFRTVADALATRRIDLAVCKADELPASIVRRPLLRVHFVCLFDPRFVRLGARPTERAYLAQDHIIVSYNGDLRGLVEDYFEKERRVRCSVASFASIGAIVDGSRLVATIPSVVAEQILAARPHLRTAQFPFPHTSGSIELLWPTALDVDPACRFVRDVIGHLGKEGGTTKSLVRRPGARKAPSSPR